jgi:hypothetical protein
LVDGVRTAEELNGKSPSIQEISKSRLATWFGRNRFAVKVTVGAICALTLVGFTGTIISHSFLHRAPVVQQRPDPSAERDPNRPKQEPSRRHEDTLVKAPEVPVLPPGTDTTRPAVIPPDDHKTAKKPPETELISKNLSVKPSIPPKVAGSDAGKSNPANTVVGGANRPEVKPPEIRPETGKTEAKNNDPVSRQSPEQIAGGSPPLTPPGVRVGDPGATAIQRAEPPALTLPRPQPEPLRPEPREPPVSPLPPPVRNVPASGTLNWSLQVRKGSVESLESQAATTGVISGEGLPGVPVSITLSPPGVAGVVEAPAPSNGWKTLKLRGLVNARIIISIQWKRL